MPDNTDQLISEAREELERPGRTQINDIELPIDPLSLSVEVFHRLETIDTIRSRSDIQRRTGYGTIIVRASLCFSGVSQINDALIPLLIQFRKTPFCYIENEALTKALIFKFPGLLGMEDPTSLLPEVGSSRMASSILQLMSLSYMSHPSSPESVIVDCTWQVFNYLPYMNEWRYWTDYPSQKALASDHRFKKKKVSHDLLENYANLIHNPGYMGRATTNPVSSAAWKVFYKNGTYSGNEEIWRELDPNKRDSEADDRPHNALVEVTKGGKQLYKNNIDDSVAFVFRHYILALNGASLEEINRNITEVRRVFPQSGPVRDGWWLPIVQGTYSRGYSTERSPHPVTSAFVQHRAIDIEANTGTPVHSYADGEVERIWWDTSGGGKAIKIKHLRNKTSYGHLSAYAENIKEGDQVEAGQLIGYVGATGITTGPHLHLSFFKLNGDRLNPEIPGEVDFSHFPSSSTGSAPQAREDSNPDTTVELLATEGYHSVYVNLLTNEERARENNNKLLKNTFFKDYLIAPSKNDVVCESIGAGFENKIAVLPMKSHVLATSQHMGTSDIKVFLGLRSPGVKESSGKFGLNPVLQTVINTIKIANDQLIRFKYIPFKQHFWVRSDLLQPINIAPQFHGLRNKFHGKVENLGPGFEKTTDKVDLSKKFLAINPENYEVQSDPNSPGSFTLNLTGIATSQDENEQEKIDNLLDSPGDFLTKLIKVFMEDFKTKRSLYDLYPAEVFKRILERWDVDDPNLEAHELVIVRLSHAIYDAYKLYLFTGLMKEGIQRHSLEEDLFAVVNRQETFGLLDMAFKGIGIASLLFSVIQGASTGAAIGTLAGPFAPLAAVLGGIIGGGLVLGGTVGTYYLDSQVNNINSVRALSLENAKNTKIEAKKRLKQGTRIDTFLTDGYGFSTGLGYQQTGIDLSSKTDDFFSRFEVELDTSPRDPVGFNGPPASPFPIEGIIKKFEQELVAAYYASYEKFENNSRLDYMGFVVQSLILRGQGLGKHPFPDLMLPGNPFILKIINSMGISNEYSKLIAKYKMPPYFFLVNESWEKEVFTKEDLTKAFDLGRQAISTYSETVKAKEKENSKEPLNYKTVYVSNFNNNDVDSDKKNPKLTTIAQEYSLEETPKKIVQYFEEKYKKNPSLLLPFSPNKMAPTFKLYFREKTSESAFFNTFDDFYGLNAIRKITVSSSRKYPMSVAVIEISNLDGHLTNRKYGGQKGLYTTKGDKAKSSLVREAKNIEEHPISDILIQDGTDIQIRLGYSSDPNELETVFNGQIFSVDGEDIITLKCYSYGYELMSKEYGIAHEDLTGLSTYDDTPELLEWCLNRDEVIHFGRKELIHRLLSKIPDIRNIDKNEIANKLTSGQKLTRQSLVNSFNLGGSVRPDGKLNSTWQTVNAPEDDNIRVEAILEPDQWWRIWGARRTEILKPDPDDTIWELAGTLVAAAFQKAIAANIFGTKQVYLGVYTPFQQTLWDVINEMTLRHVRHIAAVRPFEDRVTLFFGNPNLEYFYRSRTDFEKILLANRLVSVLNTQKISPEQVRQEFESKRPPESTLQRAVYFLSSTSREEIEGDLSRGIERRSRKLNEKLITQTVDDVSGQSLDPLPKKLASISKPFRDYHLIDSDHHIISNNIRADYNGTFNEITVKYTADADDSDDPSEFKGPTLKLNENIKDNYVRSMAMGFTNVRREDIAKRYGMSLLQQSSYELYKGSITILGNERIKPHDFCLLYDKYNDMAGPFQVREVVHTLTVDGGFTTEIIPDMIANINDYVLVSSLTAVSKVFGDVYSQYQHQSYTTAILASSTVIMSALGAYATFRLAKAGLRGIVGGIRKLGSQSDKLDSVSNKIQTAIQKNKDIEISIEQERERLKTFRKSFKSDIGKRTSLAAKATKLGAQRRAGTFITDVLKGKKGIIKLPGWVGLAVGSAIIGYAVINTIFDFADDRNENAVILVPLMRGNIPYVYGINGYQIEGFSMNIRGKIVDSIRALDKGGELLREVTKDDGYRSYALLAYELFWKD